MTPTVLITLGRLPKALELCRGFSRMGWRVVVAEPHARHLCGVSRDVALSVQVPPPAEGQRAYLEALALVARQEGARLVVPVSEEILHVAHLPKLLPAVPVLTMPPDLVLRLHHKGGFVAAMQAIGVDVPETYLLGTAEAAALAAKADVVVKPTHACSGRGVRVIRRGAGLPQDEDAVVQRFVAGPEFSSCTLAADGQVLGTAIYRGLQFGGSVAIAFERVGHPAIESWITQAVAALDWTGFIAFDFRLDEAGRVFGIECNPRTTSGLHFFEPEDVARAILTPAPLRFRPATRLQQFWSCLTETQLALFRRNGDFGRNLRSLLTTRDASWSSRDPWPLLGMPWTAWPIMREAARRRVPFGEVATLDLAWSSDDDITTTGAAREKAASRTLPAI